MNFFRLRGCRLTVLLFFHIAAGVNVYVDRREREKNVLCIKMYNE